MDTGSKEWQPRYVCFVLINQWSSARRFEVKEDILDTVYYTVSGIRTHVQYSSRM